MQIFLLDKDIGHKILHDKSNQYIIFGRDTKKYWAKPENIGELIENNRLIKLRYTFMEFGEQYE